MLLLDRLLERKALKTITAGTTSSHWLLSTLTAESFATKSSKEAFQYISRYAMENSKIATWDMLIHDPGVSEETRDVLKTFNKKIKSNKTSCQNIATGLDKYRKLRLLYEGIRSSGEKLQKPTIDADKIADELAELAVRIKSKSDSIVHHRVGVGNNTAKLVEDILEGKSLVAIPTGFKTFDRRNRGIFLGSLMIIAANTGGGKTALALQMKRNMAEQGVKVGYISLEMLGNEVMLRDLSAYSDIELHKLINPERLTDTERKKIKKSYADRVRHLKKVDAVETIHVPNEDMTIDELLFSTKAFGYKVTFVDYISLLKGTDGADQWKQLGSIARFCKVYARSTNTIVVLLAQVTSEGLLRYSRTMQEHANNSWMWVRDQLSKDTHILRLQQPKARNQEDFPFELLEEFKFMRVVDVPDGYKPPEPSNNAGPKGGFNTTNTGGSKYGKSAKDGKKRQIIDDSDYFSKKGSSL